MKTAMGIQKVAEANEVPYRWDSGGLLCAALALVIAPSVWGTRRGSRCSGVWKGSRWWGTIGVSASFGYDGQERYNSRHFESNVQISHSPHVPDHPVLDLAPWP